MSKYYFNKYRPTFFTGFEDDFDHIEFDNFDDFISTYEKKYPLEDGYRYCYTYLDFYNEYTLMIINKDKSSWYVVGKTNFPLNTMYENFYGDAYDK